MFLSARYRPNIWPFWVLTVFEFCLTVALLALVGIASPNLYRTKLWADGAENGFNSSPKARLYAAANYRPYTTPKVWSQFITNYNLVVVVLSMFLMLVKTIMYMLHVFPPIVNCLLHLVLAIIYVVSIYYQASSDTSDPKALQNGPPWYITKSCSVAKHPGNIGYCQQAKATFGCFMAMLVVFLAYFGFALFSCFPSKQHQAEYAEKRRLKQEKYASLYAQDDEPPKTAQSLAYTVPGTPGIENLNPMTPRTFTFNKLSGTKNLRLQIGKKSVEQSYNNMNYPMASPGFPQSGYPQQHHQQHHQQQQQPQGYPQQGYPQQQQQQVYPQQTAYPSPPDAYSDANGNGKAPMYFPPPPK